MRNTYSNRNHLHHPLPPPFTYTIHTYMYKLYITVICNLIRKPLYILNCSILPLLFLIFDLWCKCSPSDYFIQMNSCLSGNWITGIPCLSQYSLKYMSFFSYANPRGGCGGRFFFYWWESTLTVTCQNCLPMPGFFQAIFCIIFRLKIMADWSSYYLPISTFSLVLKGLNFRPKPSST